MQLSLGAGESLGETVGAPLTVGVGSVLMVGVGAELMLGDGFGESVGESGCRTIFPTAAVRPWAVGGRPSGLGAAFPSAVRPAAAARTLANWFFMIELSSACSIDWLCR
jgi:hypothetical protein